jgi:hypothetical protein
VIRAAESKRPLAEARRSCTCEKDPTTCAGHWGLALWAFGAMALPALDVVQDRAAAADIARAAGYPLEQEGSAR